MFNDHLQRNVKTRVAQDVVDSIHNEVFQALHVQRLVFFLQPCHAQLVVMRLLNCFDTITDFVIRLDHKVLEVSEDLEPTLRSGFSVQIVTLADTAGFANDAVKFDDGVRHESSLLRKLLLFNILHVNVAKEARSVLVKQFKLRNQTVDSIGSQCL